MSSPWYCWSCVGAALQVALGAAALAVAPAAAAIAPAVAEVARCPC